MIRRFLLLLLAILCLSGTRRGIVVVVVAERAETNLLRTHTTANSHNPTTQHQYQQRHRELAASDWWYSLLNLLHVPCPDNHDSDRPAGHCAHPSHTHVGGGGGGDDDDDSSDDGTDADAGDDDNSYWEGDDHDDDDGDDAWQGDGNDDEWQSNTLNNAGSTSGSEGGGDNDGWAWGTAALLACAVGGAAFAVTRKRKRERGQRHLPRDTSDIPQDVYVRGDLSESNGRRSVARGAGAGAGVVIDHDDNDCNDDVNVEMDERTYEGTVIVVDGCQGTVDDGDRPIVDRNDGNRPEEAADTATVKSSSRFGLISALSRRSRSGHGRGLKKKRSAFGLRSVRSMGRSRSTPAAENNGNDGDDEDGDATGNYRAPAPTTSPAIIAFSDEGATEVVVAREDGGAEL